NRAACRRRRGGARAPDAGPRACASPTLPGAPTASRWARSRPGGESSLAPPAREPSPYQVDDAPRVRHVAEVRVMPFLIDRAHRDLDDRMAVRHGGQEKLGLGVEAPRPWRDAREQSGRIDTKPALRVRKRLTREAGQKKRAHVISQTAAPRHRL